MNRIILCILFSVGFSLSFHAMASTSDSLEKKINSTLDKKVEIELELAKTDGDVKMLETNLREKRKILLKRTRALSYLKNFKWGSILSVDDSSAFERNLKIMNRINKYDLELFKDYKAAIRNLAQGRADLLAYNSELGKLVKSLKSQEAALTADEEQRSKAMALENRRSLLHIKGQLLFPINGPIKLGYGSFRDQENEYALMVRGLLFSTAEKTPVAAVAAGKIIFQESIPFWGQAVIIEHDDNYFSVYAGLQSSELISDTVQMNDKIAVTNGKEFYFELRHFNNPINPRTWLKEKL